MHYKTQCVSCYFETCGSLKTNISIPSQPWQSLTPKTSPNNNIIISQSPLVFMMAAPQNSGKPLVGNAQENNLAGGNGGEA